MTIEIVVPKISNEKKSGVIIRWYKNDNDPVKEGEEICEVMIEKTTIGVTAPAEGRLKIVKQDNEEIEEGEVIGYVED